MGHNRQAKKVTCCNSEKILDATTTEPIITLSPHPHNGVHFYAPAIIIIILAGALFRRLRPLSKQFFVVTTHGVSAITSLTPVIVTGYRVP